MKGFIWILPQGEGPFSTPISITQVTMAWMLPSQSQPGSFLAHFHSQVIMSFPWEDKVVLLLLCGFRQTAQGKK